MSSGDQQQVTDDESSRLTEASSSHNPINASPPSTATTTLSTQCLPHHNSPNRSQSPPTATTNVPLHQGVTTSTADSNDEMKRAVAKKLIEQYFYQLSNGCGNPTCGNRHCASSGQVSTLSPNQAAARAIQLYTQEAELCDVHPSKIARTQLDGGEASAGAVANEPPPTTTTATNAASKDFGLIHEYGMADLEVDSSHRSTVRDSATASTSAPRPPYTASILSSSLSAALRNATAAATLSSSATRPKIADDFLDERKLGHLVDECARDTNHAPLIRMLGRIFSTRDCLAASFQHQPARKPQINQMLERAPADLQSLKKEDFRALEGDLDKDEDDSADHEPAAPEPHDTTVDVAGLRRIMKRLYDAHMVAFETINNAVHSLATILTVDLKFNLSHEQYEEVITVFVIVFEVAAVASSEFMDHSLPTVCKAAALLPVWAQARLARIWATHCRDSLRTILETLQQMISLQVIACADNQQFFVQDNEQVVWATKVMKIVYYANLLAGRMESSKLRDDDDEDPDAVAMSAIPDEEELFYGYNSGRPPKGASLVEDMLAAELGVNVLDCRQPLLAFDEFYNEPLSDAIEMDNDYLNYKNRRHDQHKFSFMLYSFILTPATKTLALYYDNRIRMYSERRMSIFHTELAGHPQNPYLKLKVRREQIIDDALIGLELIAMGNPKDLKKQLVVEFVGEQGIDEGGVSKEFFQLVVEQIFNPDYGMFVAQDSTSTCWFNSTSFENEAQFTLIGIVLGLAIYNNIILAVNFPMVVYRKLMGIRGSFVDLEDWNPELHRSLGSLLAYEEPDMEEMFMLTFRCSYADVFGNVMTHDLKPDGDSIAVGQANKQEFVDLYTDFLLNTSVEKQFRSFRRGFQMVTDESPLHLLFRPEEIELLVCGSKQFDFDELEKATEYEGGFTDKSQTIVDFWAIVHALPMEYKKKLLEFTTGSDRVPVGGLSRLKLMIARNGPDSDRLPTSHTCFNVLLLPEYTDKEKLKDRLLKAINYSKGFGML